MRKLFSLFVALLATTALWAHDFEVDGIYYNFLDGNNVAVTYKGSYHYPSAYSGEVTIPETVTYNGTTYSVTSIRSDAFQSCSSLTSITIPNSVTSIAYSAFSGCSSLTSVTIPNSVTSIGDKAFYNCSSLTSVTIPNSVTDIRYSAFSGCSSLTSITIPNSVTSIGGYAFEYCRSLTSITIPISVTSIGDNAFSYCSSLTSVTIPNSVTSIGDNAFSYCSSLTSVTIPNSVTSIGKSTFSSCSSLTSIVIPNSVTSIGYGVFSGCTSLTSITIPNSVTSVGNYAFYKCSSLTSITIPNCVTSIGNSAFSGCSSLTSVTIPNSVTSIGEAAFRECFSLTSITIPNSVTSIGNNAFYNCYALRYVTCLGTTPPQGSGSVSKKTVIYIPDNTLSAYQQAWGDEYLFINNESSLTLHVETSGTLSDLIFDAGMRPVNVAKLTLTGTLNDDDFACMRETMTVLVDVDLSGINNTSGVNFKNKSNLVRVVLPNNLTSIGDNVFSGCSSLTSFAIPESVTSIGSSAFKDCSSLTSLIIPESVTSIGNSAFSGCYSLTSLIIPENVTSIGSSAFKDCSSLTSLIIPESVTSIGNSAFSGCYSLTSITIPNSVTSIGNYAFSGCSSLTTVTIPNSVTSIGYRAFYDCDDLISITCLGITPPNASDLGTPTSTCTLTVPHSAYNAYLRHAYWGQFLNINTGYLVTLQANNNQWGEVTGAGIYTQEATITATPNEGYTFLRWSDGNTDNPRTIQVTSDTTLTAEFAIEGGCLVIFVDWDGTVLSSVSVVSGDAATAPADPIREGYTFIGWDKDFSAVTDHMTVTAQYQINRYRVRFFDDDTLLKTDFVEYQSAAVAPANPYHEGYTFIGWDQAFDSITSDLDVYAQYEMGEDRDMIIVFTNSNDDSEVLSQSITIKIPAAPEIAGFTFLYWQPVAEPITNVITIQAIYEADIPTSAPEEYINPANPAQKLLRNGQVYILQDGKTYTIMGAPIQ